MHAPAQVNSAYVNDSFGLESETIVSFAPPPPISGTMKVSLIDSISSKGKPPASSTRDKLAQVYR